MKLLPILLATLLLAACGFRPLHNAVDSAMVETDAQSPLRAIRIVSSNRNNSDDRRMAYLITQSLTDRLGTTPTPRYELSLRPRVRRSGLAVGPDDVATRFDYNVSTSIALTDIKTGDVVFSDRVYATSSFGAPTDPYGRISAELSAAELASRDASDRIFTELALHFAGVDAGTNEVLGIPEDTDATVPEPEDFTDLEDLPEDQPEDQP